jgi:hypothetical protein
VWEPPWKKLVEQLKRTDFESPYLDRLTERLDRYSDGRSLEKEILQEMACALQRAEDKVNFALLELDMLDREIAAASGEPQRRQQIDAFNEKRREAQKKRHELVIHREALGLYHHEGLERFYPIPPPRRR